MSARFNNYTMGVNNGFMLADQARAGEGWDPLPDGQGQIPWRPLNFAPVSMILQDFSAQPAHLRLTVLGIFPLFGAIGQPRSWNGKCEARKDS